MTDHGGHHPEHYNYCHSHRVPCVAPSVDSWKNEDESEAWSGLSVSVHKRVTNKPRDEREIAASANQLLSPDRLVAAD